MNELAKNYSPAEVEDKWYAYWMEHNLFGSTPDQREPYTIVIPPPYGPHAQQYHTGYPYTPCAYGG